MDISERTKEPNSVEVEPKTPVLNELRERIDRLQSLLSFRYGGWAWHLAVRSQMKDLIEWWEK